MNKWDDMREAVQDANSTLDAADSVVDDLAYMLKGRLNKVSRGWVLSLLKKELKRWNIHTEQWRP